MTVRIGLIGAGGIAGAHINALKQIPQAKIVSVADIDIEKAKQRADSVEAKAFDDFEEMLDKVQLDGIWLCTPQNVRAKPIELAIEKGIPVFTEKPVADTLETARAIAQKIEASNHPVAVGYVLRYMKIVEKARELIANDNIAIVNSVYCCPMSLEYKAGKSVRNWFFKKEISGGPIGDQATHLFDLLRFLKGEITDICAIADNYTHPKTDEYTIEDVYAIAFKFADGSLGTHSHTWGHNRWISAITLFGENGKYVLDFSGTLTYTINDSEPVTEKPEDNAMYNEDKAFVEMIEQQDFSAIRSTYSDGVKTLELTQKCIEI